MLRVDRPSVLNALDAATARELAEQLKQADADESVRAVVLAGGERAFCTGADIGDLRCWDLRVTKPDEELWHGLRVMGTPVIAAVRGVALGGGCELVLHADITIAGVSARFGFPEVNIGLIPGAGGTQLLPRTVGRALAAEMILNARVLTADEAQAAGLVGRVVADDAVEAEAVSLAEDIATRAPLAVRCAKASLRAASELPLEGGLRVERSHFAALVETDDHREGIDSFLEKRPPTWQGR
jgi:enoyl-CoA hydratase